MQANLQKCKVSSDDFPMQGSLIFFQTVEYGESRVVGPYQSAKIKIPFYPNF